MLPKSPRVRRRALWLGTPAVVVAIVAAVIVLAPSHGETSGAPATTEGPAQLANTAHDLRLTRADRRAIDATLDRFIPAAMGRRDMTLAWKLSGPELRSGSTLAEWRRGDTPVPDYPANGKGYHDWETVDTGPSSVDFNLLLHPRAGSKLASYEFAGQFVKQHGTWLVNRMYTIAIFNRVTKTKHEIGPADFFPQSSSSGAVPKGHATLGGIGLLPVIGLLCLILAVPLALAGIALVRALRWRRIVRSSPRRELPPLPRRHAEDDVPERVTRH